MQTNVDILLKRKSILTINKVIRNTYLLLSVTILFSAFASYFSIVLDAKPLGFLLWVVVYFALLFFVHKFKTSILGIVGVFLFTGFMGYTVGPYIKFFLHMPNGAQIVFMSLVLTGFLFSSLSFYALVSRKNFSFLGGFLCIGMFIVLIAIIINLFFHVAFVHIVISGVFIISSSGFILYETSEMVHGGENNYILATINLYVQIYNLFVSLLSIFSYFTGRE